MYYMGQGVPQDYKQAFVWISVAAASDGKAETMKERDSAAEKLTPKALEEAQQMATALFAKIEANKGKP